MPTYEYLCPKCKKKFTVILSISGHDARKAKCPKCGGKKVEQLITSFQTKTSRKSWTLLLGWSRGLASASQSLASISIPKCSSVLWTNNLQRRVLSSFLSWSPHHPISLSPHLLIIEFPNGRGQSAVADELLLPLIWSLPGCQPSLSWKESFSLKPQSHLL